VLLYPMGLIGLLYDSMRFFRDIGVTADRVHLCDLRSLDIAFFGVGQGAERVSLPEWLQAHRTPVLDAYFAIPYGTFLFVMVGYAIYLYFRREDLLRRFAWSYFFLNVAGFLTYHFYPAAPPWYFASHGCEVDMLAHASAGPNLESVDAMLGFGFFGGLYGRSNDLFGAMPSLHVAYPVLILFAGWHFHRWVGRTLGLLFFFSMTIASVYLLHHWVVDAVVGIVYGVASSVAAALLCAKRGEAHAGEVPGVAPAKPGP